MLLHFMQIFWHGFTCLRIESSCGDQEATLVTNPYESDRGLRFPRTLAPDIVALTHQEQKRFPLDGFVSKPFVISNPGEYEVRGIFAYVMPIVLDPRERVHALMYKFEVEGMAVGFLANITRVLTEEEEGLLGDIDILALPVGGGSDLSAKQAMEIVGAVEPRLVLPLNFAVDGVKEDLESADTFCKLFGVAKRQDGNKLKIVKKDLPSEELVVVVLERA